MDLESTQMMDAIAIGLAACIGIGGMLMMFTDVFTRKKRR
ncbi:hypothetical protein KR51_00017380 [Rubidibacter lacunae KORDI 51-2]|uniref:Uncharacterized protein n=1 Tax=Rubidibacter lacunae KORDI 51-2 TaxID=582515 RepID=U5DM54_9CHRO|nr:hypothetical protein KR51_00017380 [Rubidibacter lacunae KORDI 51-2]